MKLDAVCAGKHCLVQTPLSLDVAINIMHIVSENGNTLNMQRLTL